MDRQCGAGRCGQQCRRPWYHRRRSDAARAAGERIAQNSRVDRQALRHEHHAYVAYGSRCGGTGCQVSHQSRYDRRRQPRQSDRAAKTSRGDRHARRRFHGGGDPRRPSGRAGRGGRRHGSRRTYRRADDHGAHASCGSSGESPRRLRRRHCRRPRHGGRFLARSQGRSGGNSLRLFQRMHGASRLQTGTCQGERALHRGDRRQHGASRALHRQ